jgi:hypothetical protein
MHCRINEVTSKMRRVSQMRKSTKCTASLKPKVMAITKRIIVIITFLMMVKRVK